MLVLSRKDGESIHIGDEIVITIKETKRGKSVLMIDAPRSIRVLRNELLQDKPECTDALATEGVS